MERRVSKFKSAKSLADFDGNITIIGCGSICRALMPMLIKLMTFKSLSIIDRLDNRKYIKDYLRQPHVKFHKLEVTEKNYKSLLSGFITAGDMLVDLAYDIGTAQLLQFCHERDIMFLNMSVEEFDPFSRAHKKPQDFTLYHRNQVIRENAKNWHTDKINPTAIIDTGMNPGYVSALAKRGMVDISKRILKDPKVSAERKDRIRSYIKHGYFKHLAREIGLKVIHITEKDTQISVLPKKPDEYVNTWSVSGFAEETCAPAELGFGTHERKLPAEAFEHSSGEKNQICLHLRGCNKFLRSWQRSGPYIGMLIRHGESYSLSSRLTLHKEELNNPRSYLHDELRHTDMKNPIYRPSVYFVYLPCDNGMATIHKLRENNYELGNNLRNMYKDIISGMDEISCLLIGDFGLWWIGSSLDIKETRAMVDADKNDINATGLQAAGSMISSMIYAVRHRNIGLCFVDDINYKEYDKIARMFMGPVHSMPIKLPKSEMSAIKKGQFETFEINEYIL